jgi:hypothetical protein
VSFADWVNNGWLVAHKSSKQEIGNLLGIAARDLKDSQAKDVSDVFQAVTYSTDFSPTRGSTRSRRLPEGWHCFLRILIASKYKLLSQFMESPMFCNFLERRFRANRVVQMLLKTELSHFHPRRLLAWGSQQLGRQVCSSLRVSRPIDALP